MHRPGYHTVNGIRSELAWMRALQADGGVHTPQAISAWLARDRGLPAPVERWRKQASAAYRFVQDECWDPAIGAYMRPLLDAAVRFLRREVEAGQLREHDPVELVQLCYGAVLTPFSDAPLRARCGSACSPGGDGTTRGGRGPARREANMAQPVVNPLEPALSI